jgi:hypothetical protein
MFGLLLGMILSLLPKRYRDSLSVSVQADLKQGAIASGLAVSIVCLASFILRYLTFIQYRVGDLGQRAIDRGVEGVLVNRVVHFGMGAVATAEYLLHPLTLLLIYFAVEGAARFLAALITEEITGTLPLYVLAWIEDRFRRARAERALGPLVPDIVEPMYSPDYDLRIFTCRRKRHWDRMITVSWQDQFYEVLDEQLGRPPHYFIYRLKKSRPGRVVRIVHQCDPQEVMQEKPKQPGFLSWLGDVAQERLAEIRAQREPFKPDIIESVSGADYQLRIASQRSKPGWNDLITIEYQNDLFEVFEQRQGPSAYPYVYLLRKLPPGKIVRTVYRYSPDNSHAVEGGQPGELGA